MNEFTLTSEAILFLWIVAMCVPAQGAGEGLGLEPELSPGAGEGQVQHSKHQHPHAQDHRRHSYLQQQV